MNTPTKLIVPPQRREVIEQSADPAASLMSVISRAATDPSFDIAKMERLLDMHERIRATQAKAAYQEALAQMQPELPIIAERGGIKDRNGNVQSRYALWEDVVGDITPILSKFGFALSFRTSQQDDKFITVTGILMHKFGHREESPLTLPMDTSGSKNAVQSVGSSTSYGKRYTASSLLNLRTGEADNDGGPQRECINEKQVADLEALITEVSANKSAFLKYLKIDALEDLLAASYTTAVRALEAKRKKS